MSTRARIALGAAACLVAALAGCRQAPPRFLQRWLSEPVWQWSDAQVLERVNAVRAGRSLQPKQWLGGARPFYKARTSLARGD